jgi:hypothetical protein
LDSGLRQHFPPKVSHRQGNWNRNQVKHRHRNQYPHRCRRSQCQRQQYRQPRRGNRIHNHEYEQVVACYQQDTVLVNTGYIVRAISDEEASDSVNNGRYIEETPSTTFERRGK